MTTAIDVAKYIADQLELYGEMHLHKLAYYAQAWSLVWTGQPLFEDRIEAWKMGPVVPNLRFRTEFPDGLPITPSQTAMVDAVLSHYGHLNGGELSELSHGETPWRTTHDGTGRCSAEIQHDLMRSFYTTMVLSGGGPKAPSVTIAPADDEEILQVAAANAERWKDALELLAR